jgi:signal transduction histidine kinase
VVDRAATIATYVNVVLFGGLALVCVRAMRQRGARQAGWAAASFGLIGGLSVVALFLPADGQGISQPVIRIVLVALIGSPFALYRFAGAFEALPRRLDQVAVGITVGVVVATMVAPRFPLQGEARPLWVELYVVVYIFDWAALSAVVAYRLWRAGHDLPSVARYRTRTLSLGAAGLALAGLPGIVPEESQPIGLRIVGLLLPPLSAALFAAGFAPPAWLRAIWRRSDQIAIRRLELDLIRAEDRDRILARVLPHASRLVGGNVATFVADGEPGAAGHDAPDDVISIPLPSASGRIVVEAGAYTPLFGQDEIEMLGAVGAFVDLLLERTALLASERGARDVAERSNRELETLVYGISHDLKSPIISLLGYMELLREDHGASLDPSAGHYLDRMENAAVYMQDLLSDLLELSRIGRVNVDDEDVDLVALLEDLGVVLAGTFPEAVVDVGELPVVLMNGVRARQLFTNLVENAARHGGRADVTIRVWGAMRDDGSAVVSVADDGVGIAAEYREKAFGIFERLAGREQSTGTGIGLAVCRKIVESVGGRIGIVDAPAGTHVRIVLPPATVRGMARRQVQAVT